MLAGLYPEIRNNPLLLVTLLGNEFTGSTSVPAQMAWSLSIAGISAAQASKALGTYYQGKINMHDFMVLTLGAFPVFSVEQSIFALQEQGKIASEAALEN
ncbi:hypothetical protein J7E63_17415 [Bacillus sp. ISL-75]|uniref:hypothetical protein n=1 Tax=Bacillus sp. ISL-75 TaxID=2819137 RepID=UPI001BEC68F1|nr:hypothetical protein [Bacillus sp. ISL-75]MBT2728696.1 hypothetical protein [Bacillus sp. ISL-75]